MPTTTTRLALVQWVGVDSPSTIRTGNATNMSILDNAVTVTSGTLAAIPAASKAGRRYYATDAGIELWDTGTSWIPTTPGPPIGSMMNWAASGDPLDPDGVGRWLVADGRTISRTTYATAFARLGTTYGAGNGSTTFNIPDTRGRVVAGPDTGVSTGAANRLRSQTVSGVVNQNVVAGTGGVDAFSIVTAEAPAHHHTFTKGGLNGGHLPISNGAYGSLIFGPGAGAAATVPLATDVTDLTSTDDTGSGTAHNNSQPYLVAHHIIRVL